MNQVFRQLRWYGGLLALLSVGVAPAVAQQPTGSLSGRVTEQGTGAPLSDARVRVLGTTLETTTNASGEYRFASLAAGRAQISVLRIGYRAASDTVRIAAGEAATLDFALETTMTTLSDIVVTGTVGNQERRAQAATVSSISAADVKASAAITNVTNSCSRGLQVYPSTQHRALLGVHAPFVCAARRRSPFPIGLWSLSTE